MALTGCPATAGSTCSRATCQRVAPIPIAAVIQSRERSEDSSTRMILANRLHEGEPLSENRLAQELGQADLVGPMFVGLRKPAHMVNRGDHVRDIVNLAAVAVVEAQELAAAGR